MSAETLSALMSEDERRAFAEAFERAHAAGEISDRDFARARIKGALARWQMKAYEDAGRPEPVPDNIMDGRPPIERVGIPAVDKALPYVTKPAHVFLSALDYLLKESDEALQIAGNRAANCDEAAALLRKAAALLKGADNEPLGRLVDSIAPWAERGKYGRVFPHQWTSGHLYAEQWGDALSASLEGQKGQSITECKHRKGHSAIFPRLPGVPRRIRWVQHYCKTGGALWCDKGHPSLRPKHVRAGPAHRTATQSTRQPG